MRGASRRSRWLRALEAGLLVSLLLVPQGAAASASPVGGILAKVAMTLLRSRVSRLRRMSVVPSTSELGVTTTTVLAR